MLVVQLVIDIGFSFSFSLSSFLPFWGFLGLYQVSPFLFYSALLYVGMVYGFKCLPFMIYFSCDLIVDHNGFGFCWSFLGFLFHCPS